MRFWAGKCISGDRLDGKTAIITGANTGLGKSSALDFYKRGGRVVMACRNVDKTERARNEIQEKLKGVSSTGSLLVKKLDLASMESIRSFAENILKEETKIHLLVNNAGVCMCPKSYTEDGFELQFGINYLGHFLLTVLLLPRLIESGPSRIVILASTVYRAGTIDFDNLNSEKSYNRVWAYCNSKLGNILFAKELVRRLKGTNVHVYSVHPGLVNTEIKRHIMESYAFPGSVFLSNCFASFIKTPEQGAQTTIHCSVDEKVRNETGLYYEDCRAVIQSSKATDMEVAKRLWDVSCDLLKINDLDLMAKIKDYNVKNVKNSL